ncbi:hypothetical protein OS190_06480 [Sulfitobacter sp. F26204]|nr:hypothetical protein [Sulfitobacter sp. F26204]MCX7559210.1 hypothetical protein [Sulfitobacter sp. F26204]
MNNNKILTVSYGTFSCTLEGFEDSFGTMKAIAEYFRDLAADDRYFGAEPPQPDAEMLARIAQKEVSRRVQAREQDGKIVLSALEDQRGQSSDAAVTGAVGLSALVDAASDEARSNDAPSAKVAEPADKSEAQTIQMAREESVEIATEAADLDAPELVSVQETLVEEIEDTAKVTELDTTEQPVVAETIAAPVVEVTPESDAVAEGEAKADVEIDAAQASTDVAFDDIENDIVPGQADADVEAFFAESHTSRDDRTAQDMKEDAPQVEAVAPKPEAPAPDSIAAKLQRIRAVVAQHEEADEEDDYLEDQHVEDKQPGKFQAEDPATEDEADVSEELIADARADIEEALELDEATSTEAETTLKKTEAVAKEESVKDKDDVSAILSRLQSDEPETSAQEPTATKADAQHDEVNLADIDDSSDEPSVEDTVSNLFDADETVIGDADETQTPVKVSLRKTPRVAPAQELEVQNDATKAPPRARVIKVKRADLETAIEQGELEEYDAKPEAKADGEEATADASAEQTPKLDDLAPSRTKKRTALSPEEEDELARELAELEQDIPADTVKDVTPKRPLRREGTSARDVLSSIDASNETDVNRLLAETDHQMDEPESATRRDAFAHLRAAVAAKKADLAMGDSANTEDNDGAYREDLAEVVRPRRPVGGSPRTERPGETRPAPLKLVAEQRIDVAKPAVATGPVRPRRISAAVAEDTETTADGESFSDFAADMGAVTLPELLEAAAAYMSFVEGREQFSRPQLMTKVRQAGGPDRFSREEGLRSFGQLLRTGKIEKIKGGRFTVSDDIGFRPDERAAS